MAFSMNLGNIQVTIGADTSDIKKARKDVDTQMGGIRKRLKNNAQYWGKWAGRIATGLAAATTALLVFRARAVDELGKVSDKLGIATDQLAGLHLAAEQTGQSTRSLDMGIQRMTRRIAEAAQGTGEAKSALQELNLSARAMAQLSPDKQFSAIADAMQNVEAQSDRVRLAFKLFDSEGVGLLNTIQDGSAGLEEFQRQAEELGLAITRQDVAGIEAMNDTINLAKKSIEGGLNQALVKLAPIITAIANRFIEMTSDTEGFGNMLDRVINFGVNVVGVFADGWRGIQVLIKGVEVIAKGFIAALTAGFAGLIRIVQDFGNMIIDAVAWPLREVIAVAAIFSDSAEEALGKFDQIVEKSKIDVASGVEEFAKAQAESLGKAQDELHNLMMEPLPSGEIKKFVDTAQEDMKNEIQKRAPIDLTGNTGRDIDPVKEGGDEDKKKEKEKRMDPFIQELMELGKTEAELEQMRYAEKLVRLQEFSEQELAILGGYDAAKEKLRQDHKKTMEDIERAEAQAKRQILVGNLQEMLSAFTANSKKAQKIQQGIAIVNAVISGKEAAVHAWKAGMSTGGPWAPVVAAAYAAASIAKTAGLIKSIRSSSKSTGSMGGGGGMPTGAGSGGSMGGGQAPQQAPQQPKIVSIDMTGNALMNTNQVRQLIGQINEQIGDGVDLKTNMVGG